MYYTVLCLTLNIVAEKLVLIFIYFFNKPRIFHKIILIEFISKKKKAKNILMYI